MLSGLEAVFFPKQKPAFAKYEPPLPKQKPGFVNYSLGFAFDLLVVAGSALGFALGAMGMHLCSLVF
jgi:hypothetical protein